MNRYASRHLQPFSGQHIRTLVAARACDRGELRKLPATGSIG